MIGWKGGNDPAEDSGVSYKASFDIGAAWKAPLYNLNENLLVERVTANLFAGGRLTLSFKVWFFKFHVHLDVFPARFTFFDGFVRFNKDTWEDFCGGAQWLLDVTRVSLYFGMDFLECSSSLTDALGGTYYGCDWAKYFVDFRFWDQKFIELETSNGSIIDVTCDDNFVFDNK